MVWGQVKICPHSCPRFCDTSTGLLILPETSNRQKSEAPQGFLGFMGLREIITWYPERDLNPHSLAAEGF